MDSVKPKILFVQPGPVYRLHESMGELCEEMSHDYEGLVIASGPDAQADQIGSFKVQLIRRRRNTLSTIKEYLAVIQQEFDESGPDLVVTYDPLRSGLIGAHVKKKYGSAFVCEINGDYQNPVNFMEVTNDVKRSLKMWLYGRVLRRVVNRADVIQVLNAPQEEKIRKLSGSVPIVILPARSEIERFYGEEEEKRILSVGFPWYVKGMDITVAAFKKIAAEFSDWTLEILGYFPDGEQIHELAKDHSQITVSKPVHRSELPSIVARCSFLVQASRAEEMGRVLVEAMAAGKPRIGTTVGGIPTVVNDGVDGLLVPPENAGALAHAMSRLMADKDLRLKLGGAAQQRAVTEFSKDIHYRNLKALYTRILQRNASV